MAIVPLIIFVVKLLNVLTILLFIRILMSWVAPRANWYNQPMKTLYAVTEPIMAPFRSLIPPIGAIDISPIVMFLAIQMLQQVLVMVANSLA